MINKFTFKYTLDWKLGVFENWEFLKKSRTSAVQARQVTERAVELNPPNPASFIAALPQSGTRHWPDARIRERNPIYFASVYTRTISTNPMQSVFGNISKYVFIKKLQMNFTWLLVKLLLVHYIRSNFALCC